MGFKHGHARAGAHTPEYDAWRQMVRRCTVTTSREWAYYGARGIKVCDRWLKLENFLEDMGPCPKGFTIERMDNDKDYTPGNCKWASRKEQQRNRGKYNRLVEYKGRTQCMAAWAEELGFRHDTLWGRIIRWGWSPAQAFETPIQTKFRRKT